MRKLLPVFLFLFFVIGYFRTYATVTFSTYQTPEGLTPYREYLGDGTGTAMLSKDYPRVFYHYPDEDYQLSALAIFVHCYDAVNQGTFEPNLEELDLVFEESGRTYHGSMSQVVYENPNPLYGSTWQITFLTDEKMKKENWNKFTIKSEIEDSTRYKMWIAHRDYEGQGLRGEEYEASPGSFRHGPISVFFEGTPKIPSYRPIVLIHGLGGHFSDWERGGNKYLVRQALAEMMLEDPSGFDYTPDWIHNFSFGYIDPIGGEPYYNYQGNIIDIAKGLGPVLDELSSLSKESGGDGLVDVVGYSLGGVIVREYMRQNPEDRRLGKIITIAAPHQGANLLKLKEDILWWFGPASYGLEEILTRAIEPFCKPGQPLDTESFAVKQLWPEHPFIYNLNKDPLEPEDGFYTIASNIKVFFHNRVFIFDTKFSSRDLGDFVVLPESALNIPPVGETRTLFEDEFDLATVTIVLEIEELDFGRALKKSLDTDPAFRYWHLRIIQQPEVIERVVDVLRG